MVYMPPRERPDDVRISLRLPHGLHEDLAQLAEMDMRSLNAEIVYFLLESVKGRKHPEAIDD